MACNCIKEVGGAILESMTKQLKEGERLCDIKYDEGLQGVAFNLMKGTSALKTDYVFRTITKKKDGTDGKPKASHTSIMFTFCPFCGVKYVEEEEKKQQ